MAATLKKKKRKEEPVENSEFWRIRDFCHELGISLTEFHRMRRDGLLPPSYLIAGKPKMRRFLRSEVIMWLKGELSLQEIFEEPDVNPPGTE